MKEAIAILETMKKEYQQKIDALDEAIDLLKSNAISSDDVFNPVVRNEPFDFSAVKDMNTKGGGIRSDI